METRFWHSHYDYNVPASIRYPRIPVQDLLQRAANLFPDKPASNLYGTEMTFWELRRQVLKMASAMGAMGVKKGDRVAVHLPNCPQYMIAYYAAMTLGAIVVNLNPMYTAEELKAIIRNTGVTTLFTFDLVLPNIRLLCADAEIPRVVVTKVTDYIQGMKVSTPASLELEKGWMHFSLLLEGGNHTPSLRVAILPDDPALIQFTGGTTGIPKGAVLTHANIIAATMQANQWGAHLNQLTPPEKRIVLSMLPFFHVYGDIVAMNWAVFSCATQILVPRFDIDELMGILTRFERISFFPAVPTMLNAILNHPKADEMELGKKFGLLNSGGAPCPLALIEKARDMGIAFSEGWGMSETTSVGLANPNFGLMKPGSVGIPVPDTDVRVVNPEDGVTDMPRGERGELILKGPQVMQGYWNNPDETDGQIKNGWLHTGDVAIQDEDGYIFIVDRTKDMIIASGYNVYPREVDEVVFQHPKVSEAVTIGVPDAYRGETIKTFVALKPGQTATAEEIIEFCKDKLAPYKRPRSIEFKDNLPKSAVGKVLRKVLRAEEEARLKKDV
ncbi:MAG: long-chain fatty acid--CoA ligase [Deltaproteobacteria bacterium]|nr:long-chain fatty acid--CoA ligase [Deltaproteobacteria bacterium]